MGFVCSGNGLIHVASLKCLFVHPERALDRRPGDHLRGDTVQACDFPSTHMFGCFVGRKGKVKGAVEGGELLHTAPGETGKPRKQPRSLPAGGSRARGLPSGLKEGEHI